MSTKMFSWPTAVLMADFRKIRVKTGLDAYFFVRFLRMIFRLLVPIWIVSWVVLLPVTGVRSDPDGLTGLDRFTFGNIPLTQQSRYAAHVILAWVLTIWIGRSIRYEMRHFVITRQRWLMKPENASSPMRSTVLITGVPQDYLAESTLTKLFSHLPGGVRKVWLNRDLKDMPRIYERRLSAAKKLEAAETSLVCTAVKLHNKKQKAHAKAFKNTEPQVFCTEQGKHFLIDILVPKNKRPSHRLPVFSWMPFSLSFIGKKVDTIEWARQELTETNQALRQARHQLAPDVPTTTDLPGEHTHGPDVFSAGPDTAQTYPPLNSAFILFNNQMAAHMAVQVLTHHMPYRMTSKSVGVAPGDVVWSNLNMNPYEVRIRTAISWVVTISLVIACAIPVAFVGVVSNIHSLCTTYMWLAWLCDLPPVVSGLISGILSPALLTVLNMLLPRILRVLARFEGATRKTGIELSLMRRYFLFQVVNSFLVVTVSSGVVASWSDLLHKPASIPASLAQNIPRASNFFLAYEYIVLQGLSGTASGFLQLVPLVLYYAKLFVLGSTPRSVHCIRYTLRSVAWGTLFPSITVLVVITFAYGIISPIINGLSAITFFLFYQMYKYLFIWQIGGEKAGETGGMFLPRAIQHVFVGLYLQQIALVTLFFLAQNAEGEQSAIAEGVLMVVLVVFTAFFHIIINNSYGALEHYLPLTLADTTHQQGATTDPTSTSVAPPEEPDDSASYVEHIGRERTTAAELGVVSTAKAEGPQIMVLGVDEEMAGTEDCYHPASVDPEPIIWLPRDTLGLAEAEERSMRAAGIEASSQNATMDAEGHVDVTGPPPSAVRPHPNAS
ncbi:hypothetical protein VTO73DRAFT_15407 [Trametes versicolor]